ncbi:MAG: hypothetical protein ACTSSG_02050 [Candidatus Heimdallarchaeaceae archaeon]
MANIPLPPSGKSSKNDNPDANCEKYDPIMGGYCKFYITKTGECMLKYGRCDGFGVLKEKF